MTIRRFSSLRSTGITAAFVAFACMAVIVTAMPVNAQETVMDAPAATAPVDDVLADNALAQEIADLEEDMPLTEQPMAETQAESKGGFPQLDTSTYASQVFWLAVFFTLLYVLMSRLALPRMVDVFESRERHISGNLDQAAKLNDEAQKSRHKLDAALSAAQEQAQALVSAAEAAASTRTVAESTRFAEQARDRVVQAEQTIAKAKADALTSLSDIAAEVAADMVNTIAKTHLTKADALPAVKANLEKAA